MSGKKPKLQRRGRRPMIEEIEPRILYSADFAPGLVPETGPLADAEQRTVDPSGEFQHASSAQLEGRRHELVFVDPATPDYEKLIADIRAQGGEREIEVVLLDAGQDGIGQISQTLAGREEVSAVHIVSHGADGSVQLGRSSLDFDSLLKNGSKIKGWGSALSADADILIYGCNVAQSDAGRSLIEALVRLTGADVAASDDVTGHADLGGDWSLEFHAGRIDTSIVFSQSVVLDWRATLPATAAGSETRVNTSTSGTQQIDGAPTRAIAMDANGNYVVVWSGNGTQAGQTDTAGVFAQRFDANGVAQGGEFRVNTSTANTQTAPSVAMDANGNFVVAWASDHVSSGNQEVYARRFAADGTALSGEFQVNTYTTSGQGAPVVGMNASGAFVIVWESNGQDGSGTGVYAQRYDASGVAQGAEFLVNQTTAGNQSVDSVALDAAGNLVITFANPDADMNGVYMRRYNAAGTALSGEVRVNTTTVDEQSWSSLAMDPNGNYVVVWRSVAQDGSSGGIYGQRFNASGVGQGGEFQVNTTTANDQANPAVAMDVDGNFVVAWASSGQDGSGWGIYKREYDADGTANGGEVRVNTTTSNGQVNPWVAMNPDRDFVVVWGGEGTGDSAGVFMQRFSFGLVVDTVNDTLDGTTTSIAALLANKGADGRISLREAITAANNTTNVGGPDVIRFDISGAGPHTITLGSILPNITDSTIIDGWSEPDFAGTPVIVLDGTSTISRGLRIQDASGSTIRGLVIHRFTDDAIGVQGAGAVGNVIVANYVGTDATGMIDMGNGGDGIDVRDGATNTVIGGTTAALRNVISGNAEEGIQVTVAGTTGTIIQGNYIGLNAAGTAALANDSFGVVIGTGVTSATVGGTAAGAGNVISGNALANVRITNNATGVTVQGNIIGLNAAGTAAVVNGAQGVAIGSGSNTIGGNAPGARNVIAGNAAEGIEIEAGAGITSVQGNYIGTNAAGTAAAGNGADGIHVRNSGNTIGGAAAADRNVISGNSGDGIELLLGAADNNTIQGNYIGVNATATAVLGNQEHGILINVGPDGNTITGNVIGGHAFGGIRIIGNGGDNTTNNLIRANWIGTDTTGTLDFGNLLEGVALQAGAAGNQIGGAAAGQGNVIAFNDTAGVAVYTGSVGTPILRNAIYSNGGLGIELDNAFVQGTTANDVGDADTGSNNLQNFPVLLYAQSNAGFTTVTGTLNSTASSAFTIHFYSSPSGDEGAVYLGSTTITTDASGNAVINAGFAASVTAGHVITATATSAGNETSEFSAAVTVAAGGLLVVDTTSDVIDGTTTSLSALYGSKGADGLISLREALTAANNTANANASTPDRIYFNILGSSVHVITLGSLLPNVNEAVVLNGATDPDFAGAPVIEIRGGGTVANAFNVQAGGAGSTLRGFVISGFTGDAINLYGGNNLIAGNYIGTNAAGTATAVTPNAEASMRIHTGSDNNTIGGTTALDRNVIAGNGTGGNPSDNQISLHGGSNLIIGNYIGVAADGTTVIGSTNDGIDVSTGATNNIVGGVNPGEGNLIAGQAGGGVRIQNAATGTLIRGNTIWSNGTGVAVMAGSGHLIQQNSIYGNTNLGIDLVGGTETNFVTANDAPGTWTGTDRDPDAGPNDLKNFPVLATATTDGTSTITITGTLNGTGGRTYRIEFFSNPSADAPSGHGEGRTYLGFVNVTADAGGAATISTTLSGVSVAVGSSITATTTDATTNATSEFAANIAAVAANAAPMLADTVVTLNPVNEDAGAPSGAVGTLVNTLVGGVSDADAGAQQGIAITAADATNGTWWYSTNNGSSWNALGVPSAGSSCLLAADANTRIYFQPSADYNGTLASAITFRAWDRTSGSNGGTADTSGHGGTTAFSSATDTASLTVTAVNDAPVLDNSGSMTLSTITEDVIANSGDLVSAIIASAGGDRISDVDSGAVEGIAVTALVSGNGTWEYSTDGGGSWNTVGAVSNNSALLLRANDRLRFVPDGLNADTPSLSFRAWDQSSGVPGTKVDVSSNGGSTAFSSAIETASLTVSAVNDAPVLADTVVTLNSVNEDAGAPVGAVGTLISALTGGISDVDSGALEGIAITAADTANGSWWYSTDNGASWNALGAPSAASARLLEADAGTRIYFQPNADYNGTISTALTFRAWDRSSGANGGTADTSVNGGSTAFSTATDTAGITVTAVDDAPVGVADSYSVNEDATLTVDWWDTQWTRRQQITFDNAARPENLDNFPVLIALGAGDINYGETQNAGEDLRFLDRDGTALSYEIERWDEAGTSYVWVNVPRVDASSASDHIWMYYGNVSAPAGQNPAGVWTSSLRAVYHLTDGGSAISESTGNLTDAVNSGSADAVGAISRARSFDSIDDWIDIGSGVSLASSASALTVSAWINTSNLITNSPIVALSINGGAPQDSRIALERTDGGDVRLIIRHDDTTANILDTTTDPLTAGSWYHVVGVVDVANDLMQIYVNGALQISQATFFAGVQTQASSSDSAAIGSQDDGTSGYWDGLIDEVRLAAEARSANWINAEHANVTGGFVTLSGAQSAPATQGVLGNDSDLDSVNVTAVLVSGPGNAAAFTFNADGTFTYMPSADFTGTDTFTYRANDGANNSNLVTVTLTINPVNDAPVLADTVVTLNSVNEDAGAPSGAVGTLVSALVGGASDVDSGSVKGVAITDADAGNGTWWYSTNNGGTWNALSAPSTATSRLLAADANSRIYFEPNANYNGTLATAITFRAWDQTSGASGSTADTSSNGGITAFSSVTDVASISVNPVNDTPSGAPTISGTVTEDQTLTANTGGISDTDGLGVFGYQWLRNGVAIGGATAGSYALGDADVGTQISVWVSYTDGHGSAETVTSAQTVPVANVNDAPVGVPTISGTVTEDQTLTANTGGISDDDGLGVFGYQWLRNGVAIGGATASTYTLGDADVGTQISVRVSYTDGHGTAETVTSAQTAAVTNVNDVPVGVPTITGTVTEDQMLTADTAGIADADGLGVFGYQWLRDGAAIAGATGGTYTLGDADVGAQISVQVSYTDAHGTSEGPLTSAQTAAVANVNDAPVGLPTISGTVTEDQTLTASAGGISDADGLGVFGYQWLRNGVAIGGATASTYTLGDTDVGTQISVQVTYTDGYGTAETVTSAQTAPVGNVNDAPAGVPAISGTVAEDQTLTANTGGLSDADGLGAFGYQWLRDGVAIGGATAGTYTLGDTDVGTQISVQVSYTDGHGTAETVTSAQTAPVANANDVPTGALTIAGSATEDQTLTADTSTIGDADGLGTFNYQWLRDGVAVGGATTSTYILDDADVGALIEVVVSYNDGQGTLESLTSAAAGPVANVNDAPSFDSNTLTIGQGNRVILSLANLSASDVDNPWGSLTFTVSNVSGGRFELAGAPGMSISSFTQADVAGGLVVFVHDGNRLAPAYAVTVSDGTLLDGPVSAAITFTAGPLILPPVPLPPVPPPPPGDPAATPEPERDPRPTALPVPVRPTLYSPGRVDPPDAQLNEFELQAQDFRRLIRPVPTLNHFTAGPYIDPTLQLLAAAPANLEYLSTVPVDWTARSAFPDAEGTPQDRIDVLLEQVQLGGMALSVGVVWWASRISGLLGSLLASAPAWRHIDPLPVVGRDEDEEKKWYDSEDRDADANELAIADVLDAQAAGQQPQQQQQHA